MGDSLHFANLGRMTIPIIIMITTGIVGIVILVKQTHLDIPLLLFVIFELTGVIGSLCLLFNYNSFKLITIISSIITLTCIIFATALGIFWIDNIILQNITYQRLYLRQLVLSFITIFIVSLLFKTLIILEILSNIFHKKGIPGQKDLETNNADLEACSTEIPPSIGQSYQSTISKIKESVQSLTQSSKIQNPIKNTQDNENDTIANNGYDLERGYSYSGKSKKIGLGITESRCDTVDTSEIANSTPNLMFQNITMPNLPIEKSQILDTEYSQILNPIYSMHNNFNDFSHHMSEESSNDLSGSNILKHPNFEFPMKQHLGSPFGFSQHNRNTMVEEEDDNNDTEEENYYDDNTIQLLNISQPLTSNRFIEDTKKDARNIRNISPALWNKIRQNYSDGIHILDKNYWKSDSTNLFNLNPASPKFMYDDFDIQTLSTNSSNYLIDELKKEILQHGNHKVHVQQSLPNLRVNNRYGVNRSKGSFSKVLKNSLSTSTLNLNIANSKVRPSSKSLGSHHQKSVSLSTIQTTKSKSASPLKKFMNLNNLSISTDTNISETPIIEQNQDFDLSLMNSIHHSPKKKLTSRSINRNKTYSISTIQQNDNSSNLEDELLDKSESKLQSLLTKGKTLSSNNLNYINDIVGQVIVPNVMKTARVFSGTDKSTKSNNSVPSGYYGEYDKEKWRTLKKVNLGESVPVNIGDVTHLSNFSMTQA